MIALLARKLALTLFLADRLMFGLSSLYVKLIGGAVAALMLLGLILGLKHYKHSGRRVAAKARGHLSDDAHRFRQSQAQVRRSSAANPVHGRSDRHADHGHT
jgi:hypothetical protein